MAIVPKGIIVHSMAEYLKMPEGPMKAHDFLKSVKLSVHGFIHPDGTYEKMIETPTVNVGSGAIAGLGVGPQGEPGLTPAQMKRYKKKNTGPKRLRDIIGAKI